MNLMIKRGGAPERVLRVSCKYIIQKFIINIKVSIVNLNI
jgi:hypothetical protein